MERLVSISNKTNITSDDNSNVHNNITSDGVTQLVIIALDQPNSTIEKVLMFDGSPKSEEFYIYVYTGCILACIILTTSRSLLYYKICTTASKVLHNKMFANVLQAPMRFFDTNPSGK